MRKRSKLEIIVDVLDIVHKNEYTRPTHILYKTNLSVPLLRKYIRSLVKDNLLETIEKGSKTFYSTTDKGIKFIQLAKKLTAMTSIIEADQNKRSLD